jgi:hypothetical protein
MRRTVYEYLTLDLAAESLIANGHIAVANKVKYSETILESNKTAF